jgi:hypothetical protein
MIHARCVTGGAVFLELGLAVLGLNGKRAQTQQE